MARRGWRGAWVPLALAVALVAAACGGGNDSGNAQGDQTSESEQASSEPSSPASSASEGGSQASGEPIKIGGAVVLSGPAAEIGKQQQLGMQMAIDELNAGSGVMGRPVEITFKDTGGDPTKATQAVREVVQQDKVPFLFGPTLSSPTLAAAPIANQAKVIEFTTASADDARDAGKLPYTFAMSPSASIQAKTFIQYMKASGWSKPGLLAVNNALGTFNVDKMKSELEGSSDIQIADVEFHETGSVDLTPQVQKLKGAGADVMIMLNTATPDMVAGLKARGQLGWEVPVLGFSTLTFPSVRDAVGEAGMKDVFAGQQYPNFAGEGTPRVQDFISRVKKRLNEDPLTHDVQQTATGYDAIMMWADAVEATGGLDADAIKEYRESNPYEGVKITNYYDAQRHDGERSQDLVFVVANSFDDGLYTLAPNQ